MLMDTVDMFNAERWLEIAEVMSYEVHTMDVLLHPATDAAAETPAASIEGIPELAIGESAIAETPADLEYAEPELHQPRTARVLSISDLRAKLGIEQCTPAARPAPQVEGARPRIIRRREMELAAG